MRTIVNPSQTTLFDPLEQLSAPHRRSFVNSAESVFRAAILELLPVGELAKKFSATEGAPTKELYSMAGLILMMEYNDWTVEDAVEAYMWNGKTQLALNVQGSKCSVSERTVYRYLKHFVSDDEHLVQKAIDEITKTLIELGGINTDQQRLDSTHIYSNMATFGRTRMMGVTIKRFPTQVIRHDPDAYAELNEELRKRYTPSQGKLFADTAKSKDKNRYGLLRQQVAKDMLYLIGVFETHDAFKSATTFKNLVQVFNEQCEVLGDKVLIRKNTGGRVIQNPSDVDASYDGHKGPGYQAQFAETCSEENDVQFITAVIPETAADSDMEGVIPVLDELDKNDLAPKEMFADAGYGSDSNVEMAAQRGVELVSPTKANADLSAKEEDISKTLTIDDFVIDEATEEVIVCPAGHSPVSSVYDESTGKTKTVMPESACGACEFSGECPICHTSGKFNFSHTAKQRRLASRRREEATDVFRQRYSIRAGIEATNSGIKQVTGLRRLRVRGKPRVFMAIRFKVAGWNIRRASACKRIMEFVRKKLDSSSFANKARHFLPFLDFISSSVTIRFHGKQNIAA